MKLSGVVVVLGLFFALGVLETPGAAEQPETSVGLEDAVRDYTGMLPVFPGSEGFGTNTPAGRGGRVIRVTSLAPEGPGSLREALETPGHRIIVFEVGGAVDLKKGLKISEPFVTVAGQTAPAPGITVQGAGLTILTHDVLIQHVKIRVGDRPEGPEPGGRDGISIYGYPHGRTANIVIDHCSLTWAIDEALSTWHPGVSDVTIRACIIAENLSRSLHPEVEHSKGFLIGDHSRRISAIGNLFAHNMRRNPIVKGDVSALIVNNLVYNPGGEAIHFSDPERSGPSLGAVIGNVLVTGADTDRLMSMIHLMPRSRRGTLVYGLDNDADGRAQYRTWPHRGAWTDLACYPASPVRVTPLTIRPSGEAAAWVVANAGAWPGARDAVDCRIIADFQSRGGRIIDSQEEVGGFPNAKPTRHALDGLPADPNGDADGDGYTNIEEWLHVCAARVEGRTP